MNKTDEKEASFSFTALIYFNEAASIVCWRMNMKIGLADKRAREICLRALNARACSAIYEKVVSGSR